MRSDPPERLAEFPKCWRVILSTWIMDPLETLMPLLPVRLPPSIVPPEIQMWSGELPPLIAALAPVDELIWMVPFNNTQLLDSSVSELAPTVKVPLRCRTMTSLGLFARALLYWL